MSTKKELRVYILPLEIKDGLEYLEESKFIKLCEEFGEIYSVSNIVLNSLHLRLDSKAMRIIEVTVYE